METKVPFHEKYPLPFQNIHNGVVFPGGSILSTSEDLGKVRHFEVRDADVAIISYPRTGTRWTAEIVSWICGECKEAILGSTNFESAPRLERRGTLEILSKMPLTQTRVYTTHFAKNFSPAEIEKARIIVPFRNPKDNAVSNFNFYQLMKSLGSYSGSWDDFLQGYMDGFLAWGSYFDWLKSWWPIKQRENVLTVSYEDSKKDPEKTVKRIAEFLGMNLSEEKVQQIVEETRFSTMKNSLRTNVSRDPTYFTEYCNPDAVKRMEFINKGEVGQWKKHFTVKQNEEFDALIKTKLYGIDIQFIYEL